MTLRKLVCTLLPIASVLTSVCYPNLAISDTVVRAPSGPRYIDESYFGMHVRWGATTQDWPNARFRSWRVITGETTWHGMEKEKGVWQFDALDRAVVVAKTHDVEVLYTLGYPPKRSVAARYQDVWNPGIALPPEDMQEWEDYVRRVVERYKGRIKYYELMNEPHFSEVDKPRSKVDFPVAIMVEMARIASRVIKESDPQAKLVSMSPSGGQTGVRRVDAFLKAGGGKYIDIVGFHFYTGRLGPERIPDFVSALRGSMSSNGYAHLPIWNTESGFFIDGKDNPFAGRKLPDSEILHSAEQGVALVARALTLGAASGLGRFYWYSWDIPGIALSDGRGKTVAPAGYAYAKTERWLRGASIKECRTTDNQLWICPLSRGNRQARLVWNTSGAREWTVPEKWGARQYETLLGGTSDIDSEQHIQLGEAPILIVSDDQAWGTR